MLAHGAERVPDGVGCGKRSAAFAARKSTGGQRRATIIRMRTAPPTLAALAAFACVVVGLGALAGPAPAAAAPIPQRPALPVLDDLRGPRAADLARALPLALGGLPTARETAAFAAGRVAVAVVFVESDGSLDPSTEDWARRDPGNPGDRRVQGAGEGAGRSLVVERTLARRVAGGLSPCTRSVRRAAHRHHALRADLAAGQPVQQGLPVERRRVALADHGQARLRARPDRRQPAPRARLRRQGARQGRRRLGFRALRGRQPAGRRRYVPRRGHRLHGRSVRAVHGAHLRQRRLHVPPLRRGAGPRDGARLRGARRVRAAAPRLPEYRRPHRGVPRRAESQRREGRHHRPALHHARVTGHARRVLPR